MLEQFNEGVFSDKAQKVGKGLRVFGGFLFAATVATTAVVAVTKNPEMSQAIINSANDAANFMFKGGVVSYLMGAAVQSYGEVAAEIISDRQEKADLYADLYKGRQITIKPYTKEQYGRICPQH